MLTLRQRIFIIISIVVALLLAVLLYFLYNRKPSAKLDTSGPTAGQSGIPSASESSIATPGSQPPAGISALTPAPQNLPPEDLYLRQLATIFVERFWSYSNQNGDRHISDTLTLATPEMQTWMKTKALDPARLYEGVTTQVLKAVLTKKVGATATVEIGALQEISSRESATSTLAKTSVINRAGQVELKHLAGEWKVDGLYWDK